MFMYTVHTHCKLFLDVKLHVHRKMDHEAAILMIDYLKRENEDLSAVNISNCAQLKATNAEIKMFENREEIYQKDIAKYALIHKEIATIHKDMNALNAAIYKPDSRSPTPSPSPLRQRSVENNDEDEDMCKMSKEQLIKTIKTERNTMNALINKLENQKLLQTENENLKKDLLSLNQMAQQDLKMQQTQINKLQSEISSLSAKNIALNQEKRDLLALLEDKECCEAVDVSTDFVFDGSLHHEIEREYAETNDGDSESEVGAKNKIITSLLRQMKECEDILSETAQKYLLVQVIDLNLSDDDDEEETDDLEGQSADVLSFEIVGRLKLQIVGLCEQLETFHDRINGWRQQHNLKEISIGTYLQKQVDQLYNAKAPQTAGEKQSSSSWFKSLIPSRSVYSK